MDVAPHYSLFQASYLVCCYSSSLALEPIYPTSSSSTLHWLISLDMRLA